MRRVDGSSAEWSPWSVSVCPTVLVLLLTACVCAAQTSAPGLQPDEQPSTIRGIVVNSVTGAPIPRALVLTPDNRFAMLTDGEGHFEFDLPKISSNSGHTDGALSTLSPSAFMARKPGYLDDPTRPAAVEATPGAEITISLQPEGLIKGRILSSESDPSPDITVQLFSRQVQDGMPKWVRQGSSRANSNGEFRFAELLPGTYKLMTNESMDNDPAITVPGGQQYGFPPVFFPGVSNFEAAGTIQLTAGQTVQADIPATREPYFKVEIPVANPDPNTNLNVTVSVEGHNDSSYGLGYNGEKQRIEGLLPNGKYFVKAETQGQILSSGAVNLSVSGAPAEGPSLTLIPESAIPVHVTEQFTTSDSNNSVGSWSDGQHSFRFQGPRTYLQISAESTDDFGGRGGSLRPPTQQNDDSLILENLPPGQYWLRLHSSRGYVAAATMGGVDLLRQPLIVSPGSSAPIEITMRDDSAELEGTISGIDAHPPGVDSGIRFGGVASQAWVYCVPLPDSSGQFQMSWVSSDGKFNASNMAPGNYRILAFKTQQPNLPFRDAEAMKAHDSKGQVVHLSAGQKASVQLQLIPGTE